MFQVHLGSVQGGFSATGKFAKLVYTHAATVERPSVHHTVLVDCSGSTASFNHELREDSQKFVNTLPDNEWVSIVVFSGHDRAMRIAGPTKCDVNGKKILCQAIRQHVRVMDTTVFSEPLGLALQNAKTFHLKNVVHSTVLFTDGCAVPLRWGVRDEEEKSRELAKSLAGVRTVLSVIGYGYYYDSKFMSSLVSANGNSGLYRHISDIDDFSKVVSEIREAVIRTSLVSMKFEVLVGGKKAGKVLRTMPQVSVVSTDGTVSVNAIVDNKLELFVEVPNGSEVKISGTVDNVKVDEVVSAQSATAQDQTDFVMTLAADAANNGDMQTASELVSQVGAEALAETLGNAYTDKEKLEEGDSLRTMFFANRKFIGGGLKPTGPNHCVVNLLRVLIEDPQNQVFLPAGSYKLGGIRKTDERVQRDPAGSEMVVTGYRSKTDRFNFSIMGKVKAHVPNANGSGDSDEVELFRTYNVIRDGNLVLSKLMAKLSRDSFEKLKEAGAISSKATYSSTQRYIVNLEGVKVISSAWSNPTTLGLVNLLVETEELKAEQKSLNAHIKALKAVDSTLGVKAAFAESGKASEDDKVEYYQAQHCEYRLMGYKPKVYNCSALTFDQADMRVKEVRQRLIAVRFISRLIVFALEKTGSKIIQWGPVKTTARGQWPKEERLAVFGGQELKRVTWVQDIPCSADAASDADAEEPLAA